MILQSRITNKTQYNYQQKNQANISFKQVTPEHFFIKMNRFEKDSGWGQFMVDLVNSAKKTILNSNTKFEKLLYEMGDKYNHFNVRQKEQLFKPNHGESSTRMHRTSTKKRLSSSDFGKKKHFYNTNIVGSSSPSYKFGEYFPLFAQTFQKNENSLLTRKLYFIKRPNGKDKTIFKMRIFKVFQAQEKIGNKNVTLTQIGYEEPLDKSIKKCRMSLIHPPTKSRKHILGEAEKAFESLKQYKNKELSEENIEEIYEQVGKIHWCIAQSMPFKRGSAAMTDAFTKSLFEGLNIQTTPWKKSLSPDLESFATPMEEFSKKYRTFFEAQ